MATSFDGVRREHVLQAIAEHDALGSEAFLDHYGFGSAREYVLRHDGREYDSKAVLGVALRFADGRPAARSEFSGGKDGAAKVLRSLGFEVTGGDGRAADEWREAAEVGMETARSSWALAAREVLIETAGRYHSTVTYKELATAVQQRTGIRTRQLVQHWIGNVLARVAHECARRVEPNLPSLCVDSGGSVGEGYRVAVEANWAAFPGDSDEHAARERLACHSFFGASDLPADGGVPALTKQLTAVRDRARKVAARERDARPRPTCPTCSMVLPATGVCDDCD